MIQVGSLALTISLGESYTQHRKSGANICHVDRRCFTSSISHVESLIARAIMKSTDRAEQNTQRL